MGRMVLQEYGATPSYPPGPQDLSGTTGRAGAADAAADAAEAAVPFGDYGPDGAADGQAGVPRDKRTTRPRDLPGSGPTRQSDVRDSESATRPTRPGPGTFTVLCEDSFLCDNQRKAVWDWNIRTI